MSEFPDTEPTAQSDGSASTAGEIPRPATRILRKLAEGKPCQGRFPGICRFDSEHTVLAHFRTMDLSGMGFKAPDWCGAWLCDHCHTHVDTHHDAETQRDFALAVFRTQAIIARYHRHTAIAYFLGELP